MGVPQERHASYSSEKRGTDTLGPRQTKGPVVVLCYLGYRLEKLELESGGVGGSPGRIVIRCSSVPDLGYHNKGPVELGSSGLPY